MAKINYYKIKRLNLNDIFDHPAGLARYLCLDEKDSVSNELIALIQKRLDAISCFRGELIILHRILDYEKEKAQALKDRSEKDMLNFKALQELKTNACNLSKSFIRTRAFWAEKVDNVFSSVFVQKDSDLDHRIRLEMEKIDRRLERMVLFVREEYYYTTCIRPFYIAKQNKDKNGYNEILKEVLSQPKLENDEEAPFDQLANQIIDFAEKSNRTNYIDVRIDSYLAREEKRSKEKEEKQINRDTKQKDRIKSKMDKFLVQKSQTDLIRKELRQKIFNLPEYSIQKTRCYLVAILCKTEKGEKFYYFSDEGLKRQMKNADLTFDLSKAEKITKDCLDVEFPEGEVLDAGVISLLF